MPENTADRYHALSDQIEQFRATYVAHRDEPAAGWATLTSFPWCDTLDSKEIVEFISELDKVLFSYGKQEGVGKIEDVLHVWKSTADTYRAPEILGAMLDTDEGERAEVFPPAHYDQIDKRHGG